MSHKLTYTEMQLQSSGKFKCRRCHEVKPLSERYARYVGCKRCVLDRNNERRQEDHVGRLSWSAIKKLDRMRINGACLVCGCEKHEQTCSVLNLIVDLAKLGAIKREIAC